MNARSYLVRNNPAPERRFRGTTMSRLSQFFHGSATTLGIFYPTHYLVAIYPDFRDAEQARRRYEHSGDARGEAIAVPGEDVLQFADERHRRQGPGAWCMQALSRLFDTEAVYEDRDLELARHGAALLAVHCPTQQDKLAAWRCLAPAHPRTARYYSAGGIEHLALG